MGHQEVELKLRLTSEIADRLRRSGLIRSLKNGRAKTRNLRAVYFDTPDLSLKTMGLALRVRQESGKRVQTLKAANGVVPGLHDRMEWNAVIAGNGPDLAKIDDRKLRAKLRNVGLHHRVKPVFKTDIRRTSWILEYEGSSIELSLDQGKISAGRRRNEVCEAELELIEGDPLHLLRLAMEIGEAMPIFLDTRTKSSRGYNLYLNEKPRPRKAEPVNLTPEMTVWEAFTAIVNEAVGQLLANEWPVRLADDPEGIHQARVGVRRLRAAMSVFRPVLPRQQVADLKTELAWLQRGFGPARDWDVFIGETLEPLRHRLPHDEAIKTLQGQAERARERAYSDAHDVLDSRRFTRLILTLQHWVSEEAPSKKLRKPIAGPASRFIAKRHGKVMQDAGDDIEALGESALHDLRIEIKKARYTVEFLGGLFSKKGAKHYARQAGDLQDCLGGLNDAVVARYLIESVEQHDGAVSGYAKEVLAGWHAARIDAGLGNLKKIWGQFNALPNFW